MWELVVTHWRAALVTVALVLTFGGGVWLGYRVERPVVVAPTVTTAQATTIAAKVDTEWHVRDSVLTKTIEHWHTIRDSVPVHDTILVPWMAACDSLASSCQAFRDTAMLAHAADSALIASQARDIAMCRTAIPTQPSQTLDHGKWAVIGASALSIAQHAFSLIHH